MLIDVYELGAGIQRRGSSLWEAQGREQFFRMTGEVGSPLKPHAVLGVLDEK